MRTNGTKAVVLTTRSAVPEPESTAARTALWRALHVQRDAEPHVFADEIGLRLLAPDADWRERPDMDPLFSERFRTSVVARARFVEDLLAERMAAGISQYVILGAGLDTLAQRRPEIGARLRIFEVDQWAPQEWKRRRLMELGYGVPPWLHLVPVDFEAGESAWDALAVAGFDGAQPSFVASTGVSMYLTREAIAATFRQVAALREGTTLAMTFMLPIEHMPAEARPGLERAIEGARQSGTPFLSFFEPEEILAMARDAGFRDVRHVSPAVLDARYFQCRDDGLRLSSAEEFLVATN
jgi:methyltransferase (TIGR00027 family)